MVRGKALLFIIVLGLGGSFQAGCHLTVISSPSLFIKEFINSSWTQRYGGAPGDNTVRIIWSALVACFGLGGLLGSISVRCVTNYLGRKRAIIGNNVISILAAATMYTSKSTNLFEMVILSRFMFGFISGLGGSIHGLYLGESSPKEIRGMVTLTVATFIAIGRLTAQIAGLSEILGREEFWNILLCIPAFFSMIQMIVLPYFPEAPRYLLIEKGDTEQCRKALQFLWGPGEYKKEIEEMQEEQASLRGEGSKTVKDLLRDTSVRWQLLTLLVLNEGIQFCGTAGISIYSFTIFQEAGIPEDEIRYVTLGVGVSEIFTTITCGLLIDRVGRRVLLWAGFGVMATIMASITITLQLKDLSYWVPYITVALIFLFILCFGGGPAAVRPVLSNEMFVQSYRSAAFVFNGFLIWINFSIIGLTYPFLLDELKSYSFLFFSGVCLASSFYFFFIPPETKGKTPLEISENFRNIRVCSIHTDFQLEDQALRTTGYKMVEK